MRLYDEVVVHTKTGQSIQGHVRRTRGRWVVLSDAALVNGSEQPVALAGDVVIPRENVDWAQRTALAARGTA